MKTIRIIVAILFVFLSHSTIYLLEGNAQAINSNQTKFKKEISKARDFIQLLQNGENEKAAENFDETVKQNLPVASLSAIWPSLITQFGDYKGVNKSTAKDKDGYVVTSSTLEFEKNKLIAKIVFNDKLEISGLFFSPYTEESGFIKPAYADKSSFSEHKIEFGHDGWKLPGLLTIPRGKGPFPAVVLVHGSGPNDMDETVGKNKPFRDLAWGWPPMALLCCVTISELINILRNVQPLSDSL